MTSKSSAQHKDQTVRVYTNQSNRRTKDRGDRKTVFKSVLSNPFEVKWPIIPANVQNASLARVVELLQGVADYNITRQKQSRTARKIRRAQKKSKETQQDAIDDTMEMDSTQQNNQEDNETHAGASTLLAETGSATCPPEILRAITVGVNEVTKRLEEQCRTHREVVPPASGDLGHNISTEKDDGGDADKIDRPGGTDTAGSTATVSPPSSVVNAPLRSVFVCRSDVDPPLLVSHIPYLVAACNSATTDRNSLIKLVSLPKGAESSLAEAVGLRRVAVIAFDETLSKDPPLSSLLASVDTVVAPWLVGVANTPVRSAPNSETTPVRRTRTVHRRLEPTHIKQLRTTAPKDMRAAKALRAKDRAEAKAKRKAREDAKRKAKEEDARKAIDAVAVAEDESDMFLF